MCGICGLLCPAPLMDDKRDLVSKMCSTLSHRGPDASKVWTDQRIGLGHTRLAIVELSDKGAQPMVSASGRYAVTFNGEIYNYRSLQSGLVGLGVVLRGNSDTEVFLESVEAHGLQKALQSMRGMFAFALWDMRTKTLILGRDRLGEKPLYYGLVGGDFVFGSELKVFHQHPEFRAEIDRQALNAFMKYSYVPAPMSIFQNVRKLPAGNFIAGTQPMELFDCAPTAYWSHDGDPTGGYEDLDLEQLLQEVIGDQMLSDVPIGSFLSGGVDSSLVTALMQAQSALPIETFTIGFHEEGYDESGYAAAVAKHLGTHHTEWKVTEPDILNIVPRLATIYDEPFADSSQLPTVLLSQLTRRNVTVCLSGDGGDELFCGYERYLWGRKVSRALRLSPGFIKTALSSFIGLKSATQWTQWHARYGRFFPLEVTRFGERMHKIKKLLATGSDAELYDALLSVGVDSQRLVREGSSFSIVADDFPGDGGLVRAMMRHDAQNYLADDIMVKVDRATMSASLESRAPFLDHRVYEYAAKIPLAEKYRNGRSKAPLRNILYRYVPSTLIERPKMGFGVPIEQWLRTDLRDWAESLLDSHKMEQDGFLSPESVSALWSEHLAGVADHQHQLWNVLMFQQWSQGW